MEEMPMKAKVLVCGAAAVAALSAVTLPAAAQDSIPVVSNTYRTGSFSGDGIPLANGMRDYMTLVNQQGGVNGVKIAYEECETGYDTKKSIECYEQEKAKGTVIYLPWSTAAMLAAAPRSHIDKIPIFSMAYGLSASAEGGTFPWAFNPPMTYWDGASVMLSFVAQKEGGLDKLKGKKIGLIYLDAPYGKEPIPFLQNMAKKHGFELLMYPVPAAEMQNQGALWLNVRRDKPDWLYGQSFGAMTPTAIKEAIKNNFPMDHFIAVWWAGGDGDAKQGGAEAKGYKSISWHNVGADFPLVKDIIANVVDKGLSLGEKARVGESQYDRTIYQGVVLTEAIRNAQKLAGKKVISGEDLRRGFETLEITEARWKELGLAGFAAPLKLSCTDHNGHQAAFVLEWDGAKWTTDGKRIEPLHDELTPLLTTAAADYAKTDGWPKRSEACDAK
jgi:branched-chain amino acid transport system substrate-binding protein